MCSENITHTALAAEARKHFKGPILTIESEAELPALIHQMAHKGDYVIMLGAGTISQWAYALPKELERLQKTKVKKA